MILGCIIALTPIETSDIKPSDVDYYLIDKKVDEVDKPAEPIAIEYKLVTLFKPREFTYDEAQMLMQIAQAEAGNQGVSGMILIMACVLNRVADEDDFPDTIEGVIYEPYQFYTEGMTTDLSAEAHEALAYIESGKPIDTRVVAFEVSTSSYLERYFEYAYTVGDHNFYYKKGGASDGTDN